MIENFTAYSDYIFVTKEVSSPFDIMSPTGKSDIDRDIENKLIEMQDITLRKSMRTKFINDRSLRYAFHLSYIHSNPKLLWLLRTELYFFKEKESLLNFILEKEPSTFEKMDRENPGKETFIFTNNY